MAGLIYTGNTSLDGYVYDESRNFDWSVPSEEVHAFINDLERRVGTYLYGRRMYETMLVWESMPLADQPAVVQDFAQLWRTADKVVYSRTLDAVASDRTHIERTFDPTEIQAMKASATRPISIGGATLAAAAIRADLVDEFHQFLSPIIVGGGTRYFPDGVRQDLELVDERRFGNGTVHLHYRTRA